MVIHTVLPGQTLSAIAGEYGVPAQTIIWYNGLAEPDALVVGQSLLILFPELLTTAREGDTVFTVAARFSVTPTQLFRNNPQLGGRSTLTPGQTLVVALQDRGTRPVELSGYAYPFFDEETLRAILPYATYLAPFTYGLSETGLLLEPDDDALLRLAREYGVLPLLHLSSLTESGRFSSERAARLLNDPGEQVALIQSVVSETETNGYRGVDIDFEYVGAENAAAYTAFVGRLREAVNRTGRELFTALAPKVSAEQRGVLYEGHDYGALAANSDAVLLMTYEWGYTYGPPLAVAPLPNVRRVLDYAMTEMPPQKVFLGFPNYGYDWTLPYVRGTSRARSISNVRAVELAREYGAEIVFDETAQSPYFFYTDAGGSTHEVWFEDPRSAYAKFLLVPEYGFRGVGYWNFMRPFPASFALLHAMFDLVKGRETVRP